MFRRGWDQGPVQEGDWDPPLWTDRQTRMKTLFSYKFIEGWKKGLSVCHVLGITGRQTAPEVGGKTKVLQILIPFVYLQKNKCPSLVPSSIRSYVAILQTAGPGRMVFHFLTAMVLQKIAQDRT